MAINPAEHDPRWRRIEMVTIGVVTIVLAVAFFTIGVILSKYLWG